LPFKPGCGGFLHFLWHLIISGFAGLGKDGEMAGKRIDAETRRKVLVAGATGLSMKKIAERFGISATSVGRIIRESSTRASAGIDEKLLDRNAAFHKKISDIERRLAELEKKILEHEARKRKAFQG